MHESVDGWTASEFASDASNQQNVTNHSLEPPLRNIIVSKVERVQENLIPYEEIILVMKDQVACIRELEWNLCNIRIIFNIAL